MIDIPEIVFDQTSGGEIWLGPGWTLWIGLAGAVLGLIIAIIIAGRTAPEDASEVQWVYQPILFTLAGAVLAWMVSTPLYRHYLESQAEEMQRHVAAEFD